MGLTVDNVLPANSIPGEVHQHLKQIHVTEHDVLYRFEHINQDWIAMQDWTYTVEFSLTSKPSDQFVLHLDNVGTHASFKLNGKDVGQTDNLFRNYFFDLDNLYVDGRPNRLEIKIDSTVRKTFEIRAMYDKMPGQDPFWNYLWLKENWIAMSRTQQTDFGWDWGPAIVPMGLFGSVHVMQKVPFVTEKPLVI